MAFMQPVTEHMVMYHVETTMGVEYVPESVCGDIMNEPDAGRASLAEFCEGDVYRDAFFFVERKEGWYGRLSASGYLDCTEWDGPHATAQDAIDAVCEMYECDEEGNDLP
jgi:hypothetical protein